MTNLSSHTTNSSLKTELLLGFRAFEQWSHMKSSNLLLPNNLEELHCEKNHMKKNPHRNNNSTPSVFLFWCALFSCNMVEIWVHQTMAPFSSKRLFKTIRWKKKSAPFRTNSKEYRYVNFPLVIVQILSHSIWRFSVGVLCHCASDWVCHKLSPYFAVYCCYCDPFEYHASMWSFVPFWRTLFFERDFFLNWISLLESFRDQVQDSSWKISIRNR